MYFRISLDVHINDIRKLRSIGLYNSVGIEREWDKVKMRDKVLKGMAG